MGDAEIIIVGGGPVGAALGIELGLLNIKAVIIEKYNTPAQLPRAQLLNPRSMEFFRRWGISANLVTKKLLPPDFPMKVTWCSGLNGQAYSSVDTAEKLTPHLSPEQYLRIPLWLTEEVLRTRLKAFKTIEYLADQEAINIQQDAQRVRVDIRNRLTGENRQLTAKYVVGCDGANSFVRRAANIPMLTLSPAAQMLNISFKSSTLKQLISVPESLLYYNLSLTNFGCIGCVDLANDLWYAFVSCPEMVNLEEFDVAKALDDVAGFHFEKTIVRAGLWLRQTKIAESFRHNRLFLAGDAAHISPPAGGHGLNTGLGDVNNLAWKLAAVLRNQAGDKLLDTYHSERHPIAMRNLRLAEKNAKDAENIRRNFPMDVDLPGFIRENQRMSIQHAQSHGVALGYHYADSAIVCADAEGDYSDNLNFYTPRALPGFFAPHIYLQSKQVLYDVLPCNYVLMTQGEVNILEIDLLKDAFEKRNILLHITTLDEKKESSLYPDTYYLLRPDWHIAWAGNAIPDDLECFINKLMPQ